MTQTPGRLAAGPQNIKQSDSMTLYLSTLGIYPRDGKFPIDKK